MIKQFFLALLLGLIATLYVAQESLWVRQRVEGPLLALLEKSLDCRMTGNLVALNFFYPTAEFESVVATHAHNGTWAWQAQRFVLSFSWLEYMTTKRIYLDALLDTMDADSLMHNGMPSIWKFIDKLRGGIPGGLPISLKSLVVKKVAVDLREDPLKLKAKLVLDCDARRVNGAFKTGVYVRSGTVHAHDRCCLQGLKGWFRIGYEKKNSTTSALIASADYGMQLPQLAPYQACTLQATWDGTQGSLTLKNGDQSCMLEPLKITIPSLQELPEVLLQVPLRYINRMLHNDPLADDIDGTLVMHVQAEKKQNGHQARGNIKIERATYNQQEIIRLGMLSFVGNEQAARGAVYIHHNNSLRVSGPWQWDAPSQSVSATLSNADDLPLLGLQDWHIEASHLVAGIMWRAADGLRIAYEATLHNAGLDSRVACKGKIACDAHDWQVSGTVDDVAYQASGKLSPLRINTAQVVHNEATLLSLATHQQHQQRIDGVMQLSLLKMLAQRFLALEVQAEGHIDVHGLVKDGAVFCSSALHGMIRVPSTHYVVSEARARLVVDPQHKVVVLRDLFCNLNRGSLVCDRATVRLNEQYQPYFVHVPLQINNCFLSDGTKDVYACIGAHLLATYHDGIPSLSGALLVERAQLKRTGLFSQLSLNPFSSAGGKKSENALDVALDIHVATKESVHVKTMLMDMNAKIDVVVKGSLRKPSVIGSVELLSGALSFPYKPLYISKGALYFLPNQMHDPIIELVAKNKIKQYQVALQVTGSLSSNHVMLNASPTLTDEQIIALLLVGSEEHSLNTMIPALVMQNFKDFMINPDQSPMNLEAYWAHLLKPLRYIRIMPTFTDQSGRGGLRAALEIDVNERLKACVQKNFDLTEDVRFDIEYLLSDDMWLKGVRDERGDMTAEIEMRWKF